MKRGSMLTLLAMEPLLAVEPSFPRTRESIERLMCKLSMDSRLRGNDGFEVGGDC
jgi:hypothetical protein